MLKRLLISPGMIVALGVAGPAMAGSSAQSASDKARTNVYKESQAKPYAKPAAGSVEPSSEAKRPNLYQDSVNKSDAKPNQGSVNPDATTKRKKRPE